VEQERLVQAAQLPAPLLAMALPPLEAKNSESMREVCRLSHLLHAAGASASFIGRTCSNWF